MSSTGATSDADAAHWRRQRTETAEHLHRELERRQARESAQARELINAFVREATSRGIAPGALRATSRTGTATFRTSLVGWYLRSNRSLAVGQDAEFYILTVPGGLVARFRGVQVTPSDPPLVLGAGGRDGESIDIADALNAVLNRG